MAITTGMVLVGVEALLKLKQKYDDRVEAGKMTQAEAEAQFEQSVVTMAQDHQDATDDLSDAIAQKMTEARVAQIF